MSWDLGLQVIQTIAVVVGVAFGLVQLRQLREQREVQAGIELLHPLQAPESAEALLLLHGLPDNLTGEELRKRLGSDFGAVLGVLGLFESLGPLVARGHVPIEMYEDFYRGVTVLCWRKLRRYIEDTAQLRLAELVRMASVARGANGRTCAIAWCRTCLRALQGLAEERRL
jgi:hypothetical protein